MTVPSRKQLTPVCGITNILRYLYRQYYPNLYDGNGSVNSSVIESWQDTFAHFQLLDTSDKS